MAEDAEDESGTVGESNGEVYGMRRTDEVWEHEVWGKKKCWVPAGKRFCDRFGNAFKNASLGELSREMPNGWKETRPFYVDKGKDETRNGGWIYGTGGRDIDNDVAKGTLHCETDKKYQVRRRRWLRFREWNGVDDRTLLENWIGVKGKENRWDSKYAVFIPNNTDFLIGPDSMRKCIFGPMPFHCIAILGTENASLLSTFTLEEEHFNPSQIRMIPIHSDCSVADTNDEEIGGSGILSLQFKTGKKPKVFALGVERWKWATAIRDAVGKSLTFNSVRDEVEALKLKGKVLCKGIIGNEIEIYPTVLSRKDECAESSSSPRKFSEDENQPFFIFPNGYKHTLLDVELDAPVDSLFDVLFKNVEFENALFRAEGANLVERDGWNPSLSTGATRKTVYRIPRKGIRPASTAIRNEVIKQAVLSSGYHVDSITLNPNVPCGKSFEIHTRVILEPVSATSCRLWLTQEVVFVESVLFRQTISFATIREMSVYYKELWIEEVRRFLKRESTMESPSYPLDKDFSENEQANDGITTASVPEEEHVTRASHISSPRSIAGIDQNQLQPMRRAAPDHRQHANSLYEFGLLYVCLLWLALPVFALSRMMNSFAETQQDLLEQLRRELAGVPF